MGLVLLNPLGVLLNPTPSLCGSVSHLLSGDTKTSFLPLYSAKERKFFRAKLLLCICTVPYSKGLCSQLGPLRAAIIDTIPASGREVFLSPF